MRHEIARPEVDRITHLGMMAGACAGVLAVAIGYGRPLAASVAFLAGIGFLSRLQALKTRVFARMPIGRHVEPFALEDEP